jgi:hypothetical protein
MQASNNSVQKQPVQYRTCVGNPRRSRVLFARPPTGVPTRGRILYIYMYCCGFGVPGCDIIDFDIAPTYWHTPQDTLDKVDPRSLAIVGHVFIETLPALEKKFHGGRSGPLITTEPNTVALRSDSANSRIVALRDVSALVQKLLGDRSAAAFSIATLLRTGLLASFAIHVYERRVVRPLGDANELILGSSSDYWTGTAKGEGWHLRK